MYRYLFKPIIVVGLAMLFLFPINSYASGYYNQHRGWVLYDNFNSGSINPDLWDIDDTSADIFVENGRVRFNHNTAEEGDSSWLIFRKRPENIKAVKVRVKIVQGASGDSRARIGGWVGKDNEDNPIWQQLQVRNQFDRIDCWAGALTDPPGYNTELYDVFFARFETPIDVENEWFTLIMYFNKRELKYKAYGLGTIIHKLPQRILKFEEVFKGIGTRNSVDPGTGEIFSVYFDSVYVLY